tara:strand:- start:340 stop:1275 length:936 start_codon:yes stop_codon:yes gene_type:complete
MRIVIKEGDDRCTRIAKRKYDTWPSAYASGAVVRCRKGKIWKDLKEEEGTTDADIRRVIIDVLSDEGGAAGLDPIKKAVSELKTPEDFNLTQFLKDMEEVSLHRDGDYILGTLSEKKKKKAGTESSKESSLHDWFGRKGAKGKKGGWVDCNSPDGDGGYKACGREEGEKRSKYPACRPTPSACKEKGKGKSWGKKNEGTIMKITESILKDIIKEELQEALYYEMLAEGEVLEEAEYQGRKVTLNKPMQGDVKKSKVYVKNEKGNVVKVNFGDKNMKIKKNIPARRKSFRARHNCKNPGPKWKARYWSCKAW